MSEPNTVQITLDPALGIDPAEFAQAWNEDDDTLEVGLAETQQSGGLESLDPATATVLVSIGSAVATGVATTLLSDAIKSLFQRAFGSNKEPELIEIVTASGEKVYILREK